MNLPATLWSAHPFSCFTDRDRAELEAIGELRSVAAGSAVYAPGDASAGAFVLLAGEVSLRDATMSTLRGAETTHFSTPGTLISKGSLLEPFTHRHACDAVTDARLLLLPRQRFQERFVAGSGAALKLIDAIVRQTSVEVRELNAAIHRVLSES